jgi:hypothetical protein
LAAEAELKALPLSITENSTGFTTATATADVWTRMGEYQVPLGQHIVFRENDPYYFIFCDGSTTPVEVTAGSYQIWKTDALENQIEVIASGSILEFGGDLHYEQHKPRFPMDVALKQSAKLIIMVNSATAIAGANSTVLLKGVQLVEKF